MKFLLTTRDPKKTADSMMRWNNLGKRRLPIADIPGLPRGYGRETSHLEQWVAGHYSFCRKVFDGAANFLEYDIDDAEAPARLSSYLGIDLPWWGRSNVGKVPARKAG